MRSHDDDSDEVLARAQVARALEEPLIHAMIRCMTERTVIEVDSRARSHMAAISKFEAFLEAHFDQPVYLSEFALPSACPKARCVAVAMSISGWARSDISGSGG